MYKSPAARMTAGRTRLLLDFPWFGSLAMRLKVEEDEKIPTFATDGTVLKYNPKFLEKLNDGELTGTIAHEVMHCALLHPYRRGSRDLKEWNEATDYAINAQLRKSGLLLPKGTLYDPQYEGLAAEVIYAKRHKEKQQQQPQPNPKGKPGNQPSQGPAGQQPGQGTPGQGEPQPCPTGEVTDAPPQQAAPGQGEPQQMTESDWKVAAEQATAVAKGCGKLPGGAETLVKAARTPAEDWRAILQEFVEHSVPSDYSWTSPNRRHVARGVYLPGVVRENLGHVAVAIDTSGSIDQKLLAEFAAELNAIANDARAEKVSVIYCDSKVHKTEEFGPDEEITLNAIGRGGTKFQPALDAVNDWDEPPVCLVYFTDLECSDTPQEPEYPVLWVTDLSVTREVPFGRTVRIQAE